VSKSFLCTKFDSQEWAERWPKMDVREDFKRAAAQLMQKTSFPDISEGEIAAALQLAYDDGFDEARYG
jgi:hypothetical protein